MNSANHSKNIIVNKQRNYIDRGFFRICVILERRALSPLRRAWYVLRGAHIGRGSNVPSVVVTWPHQIWIGEQCELEPGIWFKHSGCLKPGPNLIIGDRTFIGHGCEFIIQSALRVGKDCLLASGCKFVDINHVFTDTTIAINLQPCEAKPITLGNNVWLGVNVVVLAGVSIGDGAVVGAGAVVTKDIPDGEIWAGVPAKRIGIRS